MTKEIISEVYNMDCVAGMREYPDKYFDLAIVDPPYGINIAEKFAGEKRKSGNGVAMKSAFEKKNWDLSIPEIEYFLELFRVSKNQIIWGGNYFELPKYRCPIIWDKCQPWENFSQVELAWSSFNKPASIFKFDNRTGGKIHPTQKPVALYKWLLDKYAKEGDKILDTHGGSCSLAIACHDYGYELTCCELDVDYYNKAVERIKNNVSQLKLF